MWQPRTYEEQVERLMKTIRAEHPGGEYPVPIHDRGECAECDSLRALRLEEEGEAS